MRILSCCLMLAIVTVAFAGDPPTAGYQAKVAPASKDYQKAMAAARLPAGMKIDLWAAEPLLANPVAFAIDHQNRIYVAETFRLHAGVTDIRGYLNPKGNYWLDEDLACRTVEDRIAMTRRKLGDQAKGWEQHHDRVRRLEDTTGDGRANKATVFADGFSRLQDGIGSGLLARGDTVWYACIPDLWQLRDPKNTGVASDRKILSTGYGVRYGFIGHDLHGLIMGPDGKIYFSIGDRGLNVPTPKGRLVYPDTGAVLRCNPDGSDLEVFASGLRNPQELAFDDHGNLFTGDNNCDSGDRARWVYIMEGGDCGWRIGYQFDGSQGSRGPWNAEKLWHPPHAGQPAWIVPPITNVADGPSGLAYYPGIGLPDRYKGHFFLADFRGGPANSGIRSFANKAKGAGFEMIDSHQFIWSVLATDVDFATDGAVMISDWVAGWGLTGKGRIWRVYDETLTKSPQAQETKAILAAGFAKREGAELAKLLEHIDRRVRQEAHFELAKRGKAGVETLSRVAHDGKGLARLHALWGLGIATRNGTADALATVPKLLNDADAEVRAQALRVLGEGKVITAVDDVIAALKDESTRVQSFAAQALAKLADARAVVPLVAMLRTNADADPWLRHAGVMGLTASADAKSLERLAADASASVRRAATLAMRRQGLADVARFLDDSDPEIVAEAARAINDVPINDAMPRLASLIGRTGLTAPTMYRVLNANFRLGTPENAAAVARFAARADAPIDLRREALKCLEDWTTPGGRDRVIGVWRPLSPREPQIVRAALRLHLAGLFSGPDAVRKDAARVAAKLGITEVGTALFTLVGDGAASPSTRAESLLALESLKDKRLDDAVKLSLAADGVLRAAGRDVLSRLRPAEALAELSKALESDEITAKQKAFDTLGSMKIEGATKILGAALDQLKEGKLATEAKLELIEAVALHPSLKNKLTDAEKGVAGGPFRYSLDGGDAHSGRDIFLNKSAVSCLRCHKTEGAGVGEVGPDLSGIGAKQKKEYLLESILMPSKVIAKGYETADIRLTNGTVRSGIVKSENDTEVRLMTPEGATIVIRKDRIESRTAGKSAMPEDLAKHLTPREMRDLVAYLASLKKEPGK